MDFERISAVLEGAIDDLKAGSPTEAYNRILEALQEDDAEPPTVRNNRPTMRSMRAATNFPAAPKGDRAAASTTAGTPSLTSTPSQKSLDWHRKMFDKYSSPPARESTQRLAYRTTPVRS